MIGYASPLELSVNCFYCKNLCSLKGRLIKFPQEKGKDGFLWLRKSLSFKLSGDWESIQEKYHYILALFIYFYQSFCSFWEKGGCLTRCSFDLCFFFSWTWMENSGKSTRSSGFFGYSLELSAFASLTENVMTLEITIEHFYYGMLKKVDE